MNIVTLPDAPMKKESKILKEQHKAGFTNSMFDLSAFVSAYVLEYREKILEKDSEHLTAKIAFEPGLLKESVELYKAQCKKLGFSHTIGRAPTLLANTEREDLDWLIYKLTISSIEICAEAGCRYILVEPLLKYGNTKEDRERNIEFYLSFAKIAKEKEIKILIRNSYRNHNGSLVRGEFSDVYRLSSFVDELNKKAENDTFAICMDIGVCNICGQNMYDFAVCLGDRIKAVIVRENNGVLDNSLIPFSYASGAVSQLDWLSVIRGLRAIDFDGELIYQFGDSQHGTTHLLRADVICYAKKVIDFLVWQIEIERVIKKYSSRVLFGAGNMCRNYMKCYGEEFPPLYTCDNNSAIWGTMFEGLEIKNPSALLELPPECAIFICNVFYDEIEEQLKEMGIKNTIERFNDEYMPSLYMDRFDAEKREVRS